MDHHEHVRADGTKFSLKQFMGLINSTKPKYFYLFIGIILLMISSAVQVYVPQMASTLVNNFDTGVDTGLLIRVVLMFLSAMLISALGGTILGIFGEDVIQKLRNELWEKLTTLKVKYFDNVKAGETTSRLVNDTSQVKQLLATTFPSTLASLILIVGSIVMMIRMNWQMTVIMLIVIPIVLVLMAPIFKFGSKIGHQRQDALAEFNGIASETLSEIRLVKTSNAEQQAQTKARSEVGKLYKIGRKEAIFDATMGPVMMLVMMSMVFGILAYGMHMVAQGTMQIGVLLAFLMYLFNMIGAVPNVATLFTEMAKASGSTKRVQELLDEEVEDFNTGIDLDLSNKTLKVENVSFAYDDSKDILKDISFEAKPNTIVAFAGPSGGGKSTIFSLIERFYQPTSGDIKMDDTNIDDINLKSYRSQIGYVSQDSAIMAGSIRDNLTYGLEQSFSDQELWDVLELAYARKFVEKMPQQLDTEVGERGVKISGGQKQRLAIARAFLRNPKLLMLDEATASLDSESEMMVQQALSNLMKGRTTLVIAHRLATIVDSDMIYFIEKGQVTGSGNHEQLVKSHDTYARYVNEQFHVEGDNVDEEK